MRSTLPASCASGGRRAPDTTSSRPVYPAPPAYTDAGLGAHRLPSRPSLTFCVGKIDSEQKRLLGHERTWPAAALLAERDPGDGACRQLSATQAPGGGHRERRAKVKALPEQACVTFNHRVSADDSIHEIYERSVALLTRKAAKFSLSVGLRRRPTCGCDALPAAANLVWGGGRGVGPPHGTSHPQPLSQESAELACKHLWPGAHVAPYLSTGGTDTRSFVNLTSAIFRFQGMTLERDYAFRE
ncbi:hypothetical protein FB451DRAFT_1410363 [Mycena latifolia]|nr:hypothetical protein FB451DRAFT_1410363 [Mycena latifolia]